MTTLHPPRADRPTPEHAAAEWSAWGTTVRLVLTEPTGLDQARELLAADLAALDLACSRFRPDSELRSLDHREGEATRISPLLTEALQVALRAARSSNGLVDPTVGGAIAEIGYDRDFAAVAPRGPSVALRIRPVPGWRQVSLDVANRQVQVPAGVQLDLGATAKAFAADRAAERLARVLGCGVLVSLGGDIAMAGPAPAGGWTVRVQDTPGRPADAPDEGPHETVRVTGGGLATSSTTARRWIRGDTVLHHLIDPLTGLPAPAPWRTVSVYAGSCVDANTASAAAVVGGRTALRWLTSVGLPARLVDVHGAVRTVGGWPAQDVR